MQLSRVRYLLLFAAVSAPVLLSASSPMQSAPQDQKVLTAAALPYVAGALAALTQLLYFVLAYLRD